MNIKRTLAFSKRVLKQFRHDKRTFAFILVMPLIMILVFGYTFGGEVSNVTVIVVNQDEKAEIIVPDGSGDFKTIELTIGDLIVDELDTDTLDIETMDNADDARELVKSSQFYDKAWAAMYIPSNFSSVFAAYAGKVAVSSNLNNQTSCESTAYFWYSNSCHPFAESDAREYTNEEECEKAGFEWYNNRCHENFSKKKEWTEEKCDDNGYFWYDDMCHDGADLTLIIDGSNPNINVAVHVEILDAMLKAYNKVLEDNPEIRELNIENPVVQKDDYAYGSGEIKFIDSFAPAIMAFAMLMATTMITIFLFIEERKMGTLDRLLASPAKESEIVVGYAIAFSIVSLLQATVILVAAISIFDIYIAEPVINNILSTFVFLILLGMGHQCLGIMLSSGAKNELQAIQFVPLVIFPSILLCGLFWPIESIPTFLRPLSYVIPLTYTIDAVRSTMIKGLGLGALVCHSFALIVFLLVMLFGAIMFLKRRK